MNALPAELQAIPVKRYDMKPGYWMGGPCVSYIESPGGEWVHASDYDAQSDEVRRLKLALKEYDDAFTEFDANSMPIRSHHDIVCVWP